MALAERYNPIAEIDWSTEEGERAAVVRALAFANSSGQEKNWETEEAQPPSGTGLMLYDIFTTSQNTVNMYVGKTKTVEPQQTAAIMKELGSLTLDEDGPPPTPYALFTAKTNLESAYNSIFVRRGALQAHVRLLNIPVPTMVTDEIGSIMIAWRTPIRLVVANFGATPDKKSFIYSSHQGQQAVSAPMNEVNLRARLQWLAE
jgi:hypothetical protein